MFCQTAIKCRFIRDLSWKNGAPVLIIRFLSGIARIAVLMLLFAAN